MLKFHHIGIFVRNLEDGITSLLNIIPSEKISPIIKDEVLGVMVQFLSDSSGIIYELVAPYGNNNPVENVLNTKKNILNHVAYISNDFSNDSYNLRAGGAIPIGKPNPAKAFNGKQVAFFLIQLGFIIELIEGEIH